MPYQDETKDTTMTFRTSTRVKSEIQELADRISQKKYSFGWASSERNCATISGLVHELCAGSVKLDNLRAQIEDIEESELRELEELLEADNDLRPQQRERIRVLRKRLGYDTQEQTMADRFISEKEEA